MSSWGWTYALLSAVDPEGTTQVATPGIGDYDPSTAQLALDGVVLVVGTDASVEFDGVNAVVTNLSDDTWEPGQNLYVYVAAMASAGGGGIPEAPNDGNSYARQAGAWVPVRPPIPDTTKTYGLTGSSTKGAKATDLTWSETVPTSGGEVTGPLTVTGDMQVTGDFTMNGPWLVLADAEAPAALFLSGAAGNYAAVVAQTEGVDRWRIYIADYTPESGGNTGSNFRIFGHDDGGSQLGEYLTIERATGNVTLHNGVFMPNLPTADPHVAGVIWNNSGNLKVSLG